MMAYTEFILCVFYVLLFCCKYNTLPLEENTRRVDQNRSSGDKKCASKWVGKHYDRK